MKKIAIALCAATIAFSLISCGSKPEPEPEIEPQAPVVEEVKEEPEVVQETVEEVPEEPEIQEPEPAIEEPVVIDNTETLQKLDESRENALNSGAAKYAETELAEIDALYAALKAKSEAGEDISAESAEIQKYYEIITYYSQALEMKDEIDEYELAEYAQNVYNEGVRLIDEIDEAEEWTDDLLEKAKEAYSKFNSVKIQGYKAWAREAREDAFEAKRKADSVKAGVARKQTYNEAVKAFKLADSLYAMQNAEKAIDNYVTAEEIFEELYEELFEARAAAQRAIEEAKRKVEESEKYAEQADNDAPISEDSDAADYIEDEDTVLLEEDEYENPEDAEADIPEDFDDYDEEDFEELDNEIEESDDEEAYEEEFDDESDDEEEEL